MRTNEESKNEVIQVDPIDLFRGVFAEGTQGMASMAGITLKGIRDGNLKQGIIAAITKLSEEGKLKLDALSTEAVDDTYQDLESLFDSIEAGIDYRKYEALRKMFIMSLTQEEKDRVYTRKLMSIVKDLTLDEILVLKVLKTEYIDDTRITSSSTWSAVIADVTGLRNGNFVQNAIGGLREKQLMPDDYFSPDVLYGLTFLGSDLVDFFIKE